MVGTYEEVKSSRIPKEGKNIGSSYLKEVHFRLRSVRG